MAADRRHLTRMGRQARAILQADPIEVLADLGYYNGEKFQTCEAHNIETYVPNSVTSHNRAKGLFDRSEFRYIAKDDEYDCPAGGLLIYRFMRTELRLVEVPGATQIRGAVAEHP